MKIKREIEKLIEQLQAGTLTPADKARLDQYLEQNPEYRSLIKADQFLKSGLNLFPEPASEKFSKMRANVIRKIRLQPEKKLTGFKHLFDQFYRFALRPEMAVAALTLIVGFFLGRIFPSGQESLNAEIIQRISRLAKQHTGLEDIRNSPYVYSNVSFEEINSEKISISFDVTAHLDMLAKKDDPLVRDVLAQSLVNPSNLGNELKVITYSQGMSDPKLKEALLYSLHAAPELAIRLKAMDELQNYKNDPAVKQAFVKVLGEEESVKMRLTAIDYLAENQIPPDSLQSIISESKATQNPAVTLKVKNYLKKF